MSAQEQDRWSIPLFRFQGVLVRLHVFFCLFAIWTLYFAWRVQQDPGNQGNLLGIAGLCLGILGCSVFLQELARLRRLRLSGGNTTTLVLGPYGGMSSFSELPRPRDEMFVHLAGPATSALLAAFAAVVLASTGSWDAKLLHPFSPAVLSNGEAVGILVAKLSLWINVLLLLLNLIPAFPFHGGRVLRSAILWRAPHLGYREASRTVVRLARLIACFMVVAAVFLLREAPGLTTWSALLLLAVLVFLGAEHEQVAAVELPTSQRGVAALPAHSADNTHSRSMLPLPSDDEPHTYRVETPTSPELLSAPVAISEHGVEEDDETKVDEILMRVHEHGIHSLSALDRAILEKASRRYREKAR